MPSSVPEPVPHSPGQALPLRIFMTSTGGRSVCTVLPLNFCEYMNGFDTLVKFYDPAKRRPMMEPVE